MHIDWKRAAARISGVLACGAAAAALTTGLSAHADTFQAGDSWYGVSQSAQSATARGSALLAITRTSPTGFTGRVIIAGRAFTVDAAYTANGALTAAGAGLRMYGTPAPAGDNNFGITFTYSTTGPADYGTLDLLRMFSPDPKSPVAFPANPGRGSYMNSAGAGGAVLVEHAPPADMPVSIYRGKVTFGSRVYDAIGTVGQTLNTDGSYSFQIIGQNVLAGTAAPRLHMSGRFMPPAITPCIMPGEIQPCIRNHGTMTGEYTLLGPDGKAEEEGLFQIAL